MHEQCVRLINRTEGKGVKEVVGADQDLELVELPAEEYPCTILEHLQVTTWDVYQYIYTHAYTSVCVTCCWGINSLTFRLSPQLML